MDVNQTRFHLLLTPQDWFDGPAPDAGPLYWDAQRSELTLRPVLTLGPDSGLPESGAPEGAFPRAARDAAGRWYWLEGDEIRVLRPDGLKSAHFWSFADWTTDLPPVLPGAAEALFQPVTPERRLPHDLKLRGMAVTSGQFLVVGVEPRLQSEEPAEHEKGGLLLFDLYGASHPRWVGWHHSFHFRPVDIAPAPDGGVWVLDGGKKQACYWLLDRHMRVCHRDGFRDGFRHEDAFWLPGIHPTAIEGLPDGTVLLLTPAKRTDGKVTVPSRVYRYRGAKRLGSFLLSIPSAQSGGAEVGLDCYDLAYLPERDLVYVAAAGGGLAFAFSLAGELQVQHLPMYGFGYRGLVAGGGEVWYDREERWLPLVAMERRRESPGIVVTLPLDGKEPECVWHRLLFDGVLPPGTAVTVESRAAESLTELERALWVSEPLPYRRGDGAELPWYKPYGAEPEGGTWELLFQAAKGRYLQLRLTLTGAGRAAPRIQAMRVWYPRFSYLREYLPDLYQEDTHSASFLDRYLTNPEGILTLLEERIARAEFLLDTRTVPEEYLPWLAGWFEVMLDQSWATWRQRFFLAHAAELFRQRGTVPGMLRAIRVATDACLDESLFTADLTVEKPGHAGHTVRIRERHRMKGGGPHRFVVQVPATRYGTSVGSETGPDPELVRRIVQMEKPAHTDFDLESYWAMFRVGEARLGYDSVLGKAPGLAPLVLGESYTAQSYLDYPPDWHPVDRVVVGRQKVAR